MGRVEVLDAMTASGLAACSIRRSTSALMVGTSGNSFVDEVGVADRVF